MSFVFWVIHFFLNSLRKPLSALATLLPVENKLRQFFADRSLEMWLLSFQKAKEELLEANAQGPTKIYWFHIASAGELEQAVPIARSLIEGKTQVRFVLSYTSPSAKPFLKNFPNLLFSFALWPFESSRIRAVLNLFNPEAVVFVRYDLWPLLLTETKKQKTKLFLVGATSRMVRSGIFGLFGRFLKFYLLKFFNHIFVVSENDAKYFSSIVGAKNVTLAGEPKWARAKERAENLQLKKPLLRAIQDWLAPVKALTHSKVLVFGSPHQEEWHVIRKLLCEKELKNVMIIAPHETDETSIRKCFELLTLPNVAVHRLSHLLEEKLRKNETFSEQEEFPKETKFGKNLIELSEAASRRFASNWGSTENFGRMIPGIEKNVLLVDSMGMLAEIYSLGDIAIVGGGFDGAIHNCLEPAAQGLPVLFGSLHNRAPEAAELLNASAAMKFETKEEMFQFLKHCDTVQDKGCASSSAGILLPRMALNSARLFECIPKTTQIIRMHLTQNE